MKAMAVLGIVLIVLGVIALVHPGIPYNTQRDVIRVGPMQSTIETQKTVEVPRVLSVLVIAGGVALLVVGLKKKS